MGDAGLRRRALSLLPMTMVASPAQAQRRRWRIANVVPQGPLHPLVKRNLAALGYVEGREVSFVDLALSTPDRAEDEIRTLLPDCDLISVWGTIGAVAASRAAPNLPIVFLSVGDPVAIGLVQSLARPGGNLTGVTFEATMLTYGKRLQLLREILPGLRHLGVLRTRGDANVGPAMVAIEAEAQRTGLVLHPVNFDGAEDLPDAFGAMRQAGAEATVVIAGARTLTLAAPIASAALRHRLPTAHGFTEAVEAGGLFCIAPNFPEMARQASAMIAKIMGGARPAEIPVEQPTHFATWINLRTAEQLGLTVPPTLLAQADRVID